MSIGFVVALVFVTGISAGVAQEGGVRAKEAEVAAAQDRLMDIRMETSAAQAAYNNALYEMNQLNGQIAQATEDLDAARKRLAEAQAELEERASQVYKSGNVAFMDVLVGVDDFSEFATRLDLWVRLLGEERAKVEAVEKAKDELAARKNDLEKQRTQRVDAVDKAIAQKERAEEAEKEAEEYLGSLNADLREAIQDKQDRQAEAALAAAEAFKAQETPAPAPKPDEPEPAPAPIPEVQVTQIKQVPVEQPDLQDEQAAADRAAAAEAAARRAERLAEKRAAERQAAQEAAEQAAAEQAAAEKAAAREARQDAKAAAEREAELAAQRAAERQAAREAAEREAELAAQRAAAERAAAQQAADEREAARLAAQRRAERQAERQAAAEAAAEASASAAAAEEEQAAQEAAEQAEASASASAAAQEETTGGRPPQEDASASASAAPVGGGGASGSGTSVIAEGQQYLGTPYVLGGTESCVPYEMMDCSCFTMTVYSAFGIALPDSPGGQMGYGTPVSGAPMAGDLLFWSEDGSGYITHVGIAMGDGTAIHASTYTGNVTQGTPISSIPGYAGARRLL
ncbi:hypothetical protein GBA63_16810 [Rubrobacter tropicus]|uniref:NlpC/P60 domain-containing protein n=1 Tax=Rubrobacter tropicus TaxID=2653851 RepID=A0A6G8QCI8_9ACTN|nr:C40 family peptidase [Rubrobacter tropicus]QIN84121.1 hypothetical protein GBA63_16810 [Rubrobacter tropicus]